MATPVYAALHGRWISCLVCGGERFREREVKLNGRAWEFPNFTWTSATGLICWHCGYVHLFVNRDIELYRARK
ncbi:hypothetical protein [Streptomyces mesophilus]|uniref:hypothetical protein n=1 Tax=Streptomyces mesophilus TaxID=1775132 RepID=UPI00332A76D8